MKRILFTLIALASLLTACTDQNEVEIAYRSTVGITAAHIFDDYEPFQEGDFDMSTDGWKLNLTLFIYNEQGELIDRAEKLCSSLSEVLVYDKYITPGSYTFVSIADFREGLGGADYKFWNITNENNIKDLSIIENESIFPVAFETLGIDIQKVIITNAVSSISADIKPVTSLVEIFMSDKDYSGWGLNGYSRFAAIAEGYFIKALKMKNMIRFTGDAIEFKYSEQVSDYNVAISNVEAKLDEKRAPTGYNYRALLPETDKGFSFVVKKKELPEADYNIWLNYCGEFETKGFSNVLPEILSNRQYVVNMILDAMQLVAMEYTADYRHEAYTQQFIEDYTYRLMEEMVATKYENILGNDLAYANLFLDSEPFNYNVEIYPYTAYYPRSNSKHFEQFVTASFLNSDFTCCSLVQLLLPDLSEDSLVHFKELLSERFLPEEEGKFGPNYFTYIEKGKPEDDSRYRVVLEKSYNADRDKYLYFLLFNLRSKYYPMVEDLWADFTTLFGADMYKVNSTLKDFGYSYLTSDYTYSVNGSDYYFTSNNEYSDMVGFVYNTDNQVSEYWVYYKPAKVDDIRKYLNLKYTSAPNENTSFKDVFYNSARDMRVALDIANGAVIYTKLDMTQHVNPADK